MSMRCKGFCRQLWRCSYRERFSVDSSSHFEMTSASSRSRTHEDFVVSDLHREIRTIWHNTWESTIASKKTFKKRNVSIFVKKSRKRSTSRRVSDDLQSVSRIKVSSREKFSKCSLSNLMIRQMKHSTKNLRFSKLFSFNVIVDRTWRYFEDDLFSINRMSSQHNRTKSAKNYKANRSRQDFESRRDHQ
jgi:hypothetical protein